MIEMINVNCVSCVGGKSQPVPEEDSASAESQSLTKIFADSILKGIHLPNYEAYRQF
jgi:hypothetical protein